MMRATAIEFRLRVAIIATMIAIGFWAPWLNLSWLNALGLSRQSTLLVWAAMGLTRLGVCSFSVATTVMIVVAILLAWKGGVLRVWGTAYLGSTVVYNSEMKVAAVMTDGPYRCVRNPLYLGSWCMIAAICFLMPPTGALWTMLLLTLFQLRLIFGEETFLTSKLGEPYLTYLQSVPRLFPSPMAVLRAMTAEGKSKPQWLHAVLAETNPIGVFLIFIVLAWRYDHILMIKALIVSFGFSLVVRAFLPKDVQGKK